MRTGVNYLIRLIAFLAILAPNAISAADGRSGFKSTDQPQNSLASIPNAAFSNPLSPDVGATLRVSIATDGTQGNADSNVTGISADERYVLFYSEANNLVSDDTNNALDVFVRDRQTGQTRLVSVDSTGVQGNADSGRSAISSDGRYVAFHSRASNLVSDDTNNFCEVDGDGDLNDNCRDIFVHDLQTGETVLVSVDSGGAQANEESFYPSISADGRYVAFNSSATNLVSDDTNERGDIFVHDRQSGETVRVSVDSDGTQANGSSTNPSISADGRYVAFESAATNLVDGDDNNTWDTFVHDLQTGDTTLVSAALGGGSGDSDSLYAFISGNGRYVVFESYASDLVTGDTGYGDIFLRDLQTEQTSRVSEPPGGGQADWSSTGASVSSDGRYVVFSSGASNLDTACDDDSKIYDVFRYDRQTEEMICVSLSTDGSNGNWLSGASFVTADGNRIAFESSASNLIAGDTNNFCDTNWDDVYGDNCWDVFVRIVDIGDERVFLPAVIR